MTTSQPEVRLLTIDEHNLERFQMLCGHSPIFRQGYRLKQEWLRQRLKEGMRYTLLQVNGRNAGMLEAIPAENAWRGVEAPGYLFIHCLWVVGRNRKHGYGRQLLDRCLEQTEGFNGVAVITSRTHWLPTRRIFLKNGFNVADELPPFELLVWRSREDAPLPHFKRNTPVFLPDITLYHSEQCPYFQNMPGAAQQAAAHLGIPMNIVHVKNAAEAQNSPCPYGVVGIFLNGELVEYRPKGTQNLIEILESKLAASKD